MFIPNLLASYTESQHRPAGAPLLNSTGHPKPGELSMYATLESGLAFARHSYLRTLSSYFVMILPSFVIDVLKCTCASALEHSLTGRGDILRHIPILPII
jgi:hypothetical protein